MEILRETIILDAVYSSYAKEKPAAYKLIKPIEMRIERINGIDMYPISGQADLYPIGNAFGRFKNWTREKKDQVKNVVQNITRPVIRINAAAPRIAFLGLVRMNVRGMATSLQQALNNQQSKDRLFNIWVKQFSGVFSDFEKSVQIGANKKRIFGPFDIELQTDTIGDPASATVAAIAAATPIIIAIAPIINSIRRSNNQKEETNLSSDIAAQAQTVPPIDLEQSTETNITAAKQATETNITAAKQATEPTNVGFKISPMLLIGGGIAAYFMFYKSKSKR